MRIEKRLPFGFVGDWGKLYKRYTPITKLEGSITVKIGEEISKTKEIIKREKNYYVDIGMDVQFKKTADTASDTEQPLQGALSSVEYTTVETTDAYFDDSRREYMCVVFPGDIVKIFGRLWIVIEIKTVSKFTPAEQKFFYCELKGLK